MGLNKYCLGDLLELLENNNSDLQFDASYVKARFRPIVYVCSPFAGDIERNIANARRYCRFAVDSGSIPLAPHLLFPQFMDDSNEHDHGLAMFMNMALMSKCAEAWVFGEHISKGMAAEIRKAKEKQRPVRYFTTDCEEVH